MTLRFALSLMLLAGAILPLACSGGERDGSVEPSAGAGGETNAGDQAGAPPQGGRGGDAGAAGETEVLELPYDPLPVPAILEVPAHVELSAHPAAFVHPRLFFTADDFDDLRGRAQTVSTAQVAVDRLLEESEAFRANALYVALRDDAAVSSDELLAAIVNDPERMLLGTADGGWYGLLAGSAYLALLEEDEPLQDELCGVLARTAELHGQSYTPNLADPTASDANLDLAFAYDLLYGCLDESERTLVRGLISSMTSGRVAFLSDVVAQVQSTGDAIRADSLVLSALAIEGEAGYDAGIFEGNLGKLESFTSRYGIHRAGQVHEDWGHFSQGMHQGALMLLAAARRGHDFFNTGRVYQALLQPFYEATPYSPGKLLGHGVGPSFDVGLGASALCPVLSYLYPDDALVAFVRMQTHRSDGDANQLRAPLPEAIFGNDFDPDISALDVARAKLLPTTFFDADRGIMRARSSFASEATLLSFDCRMDTWDLEHVQADRNNFTLHALERAWIVDARPDRSHSAWHAAVEIDGVGPSDAPRMPALLRAFEDAPLFAFATGDASATYTFNRESNSGKLLTGFVWQDFRYQPPSVDEWRTHAIRAQSMHLPVNLARRTLLFGRVPSPFVLAVDEIEQDAEEHEYVWRVPVPPELVIEDHAAGVVLRHAGDEAATAPRLFVQVLAPSADSSPMLEVRQTALSSGAMADNHGLVIVARAVSARFVVLMVPLRPDSEVPSASWDDATLELMVQGEARGLALAFGRGEAGQLEVVSATEQR